NPADVEDGRQRSGPSWQGGWGEGPGIDRVGDDPDPVRQAGTLGHDRVPDGLRHRLQTADAVVERQLPFRHAGDMDGNPAPHGAGGMGRKGPLTIVIRKGFMVAKMKEESKSRAFLKQASPFRGGHLGKLGQGDELVPGEQPAQTVTRVAVPDTSPGEISVE